MAAPAGRRHAAQVSDTARRLQQLGLVLPAPLPAFGQYVPAVLDGADLHVGGHFGTRADGSIVTGRVGEDLDVAAARRVARSAALNLLATVQDALSDLDRVRRVLGVHVVVRATPEFVDHTAVADGASDVLVEVLGERGRHSRLAVGVASLPAGLVLEVTAVLRVAPDAAGS